jgi:serine/threonine-protein kinase
MTDVADRLAAALADRYRIEGELGAGGMATVYLAQDLRHDRRVAVKVLRPELAAVIGAERFLAEIRTTANLQHPHILPLFDSGVADSFLYYVMPYVEGVSLRDRLGREKQLPITEAVRIASEIASALDYAHRHGVIHRDIKPENILLHDGSALVADFGIALAASKAGTRMTETGMSLGTPQYMSPEQAMGERELDARSDVYALGCVTYEMLTGEPPFTGPTAQSIVAKVMTAEPAEITTLRKTVPAGVAGAVRTALQKLPADRFASAREFSDALQGRGGTVATHATGSRATSVTPSTPFRRAVVPVLLAALAGMAVLAALGWRAARRDAPAQVVRFTLDLPSSMLVANAAEANNVAISPDGTMIAYALVGSTGTSALYLRRLSEPIATPLAGTDGAQQPAFSPDGQSVAYLVGNVLWRIPVGGGTPVLIGSTGAGPLGTAWTSSGQILIGAVPGLVAVPAIGGAARLLARPDTARGDLYFDQPRTLADGSMALIGITPGGGIARSHLGLVSLESGKVTSFDIPLLDPLGVIDGTLVYVAPSGALMAVDIDLRRGRVSGDPFPLGPTIATTISGASKAALSAAGTLIYQPADAAGQLGWVDAQGRFEPVMADPQPYAYPRLSPDGRKVAVAVGSNDRADVWLYDFASATPFRLTSSSISDRPEWTPDGASVLYRTNRGARSAIWWQPADLSTVASPLLASGSHDYYEAVISPDGGTLVYQQDDGAAGQADVKSRPMTGDTAARSIAASEFVEAQARISPDGKWIAYVTDASGRSEVVVQPFPGPGGRVQVSVGGGSEPVWARDGRRLFYRDGRHLVAATISTSPAFVVTGRTDLFPDTYMFARAPHANYDVSLDGTRFLMVKITARPQLVVAYGWLSELRARVRAAHAR